MLSIVSGPFVSSQHHHHLIWEKY